MPANGIIAEARETYVHMRHIVTGGFVLGFIVGLVVGLLL